MAHTVHTDHSAHHADVHTDDKADSKADHSGHHMLKCCSAACAMAAALPASILTTRALTGLPAPLHPLTQFYSSVTPDGLDRPPKSFLA